MAFNLKSATPDTTFPANGFLFGADSQSATDPSIYSHTAYLDYIKTLNTTWSGVQTLTTPVLGAATGTSLALGGATLGGNALAVTGTTLLNAGLTITQGTANASVLTSTGYSLTGSSTVGAVSYSGTWNTTGVPTAFSVAITNTASGTRALLGSFTASGAGSFELEKGGELLIGSAGSLGQRTGNVGVHGTTGGALHFGSHNGNAYLGNTASFGASMLVNNTNAKIRSDMSVSWSSDTSSFGTTDLSLFRDAASILALRVGTAAQTFRWYYSFTDASNYHRGALQTGSSYVEVAAETAGTGADNLDVRLTPAGTGNVSFPGGTLLKTTAALTDGAAASSGTLLNAPAAGNPTKWIPINDNGTTRYIPAW